MKVAPREVGVLQSVNVMTVDSSNTFSGSPLDRAAERRTDERWVAELLSDPASRAVAVTSDGVLVSGGDEPRLARLPLAAFGASERLLLGIEPGGSALFAVDATDLAAPPDGATAVGLR